MLNILVFSLLSFSVCSSFPADEDVLEISEKTQQEDLEESQADKREISDHEKSGEEYLQISEADLENGQEKREMTRQISNRGKGGPK